MVETPVMKQEVCYGVKYIQIDLQRKILYKWKSFSYSNYDAVVMLIFVCDL